MAPLHFIGQDSSNEVQHDFFGHVMSFESGSASCHVDNIANGTIASNRANGIVKCATAFLRSR